MLLDSVLHYLKSRSRPSAPARRGAAARRPSTVRLRLEALEDRALPSGYLQTNLAADQPGTALIHDPELVDAWGISINPNGTFWVSARATDVSTVYSGDVTRPDGTRSPFVKSTLTVTIPEGAPTGQVFNGTSDFVVTSGSFSGPARFIFASETGHITGWNPGVPPPPPSRIAHIKATTPGAVYTGLAIGNNGTGNFLYAADFHNGEIDVFDGTYTPTTLAGSFIDPDIPDDYAPFNIWNLAGKLYIAYARQVDGDALPDGGHGFVSAFDTNGNFLNRLVSKDHLKQPWGLALAPGDFGEFSNALLVANTANGKINAFDPTTGAFLGRLADANGETIHIDGLWGLHFGNGTVSGDRNALYFSAAGKNHDHGLFGSLRTVTVAPDDESDISSDVTMLNGADRSLLLNVVSRGIGAVGDPDDDATPATRPDGSSPLTAALIANPSSSSRLPADHSPLLGGKDAATSVADDGDSLTALDSLFVPDPLLEDEVFGNGVIPR